MEQKLTDLLLKSDEIINLLKLIVENNEILNKQNDTLKKLSVSSRKAFGEEFVKIETHVKNLQEFSVRSGINNSDNFDIINEALKNQDITSKQILSDIQKLKMEGGPSDSAVEQINKKLSTQRTYLTEMCNSMNSLEKLQKETIEATKNLPNLKQSFHGQEAVTLNENHAYLQISPCSIQYNSLTVGPTLLIKDKQCFLGVTTGLDINMFDRDSQQKGWSYASSFEIGRHGTIFYLKNKPKFLVSGIGFSPSNTKEFSTICFEKKISKNKNELNSGNFIKVRSSTNFCCTKKGGLNFYSSGDLNIILSLQSETPTIKMVDYETQSNRLSSVFHDTYNKTVDGSSFELKNSVDTISSSLSQFSRSIPLNEVKQPMRTSNFNYFNSIVVLTSALLVFFITKVFPLTKITTKRRIKD